MKNKYLFLKRIYNNYIIIFKKKGRYQVYGYDNIIIKYYFDNKVKLLKEGNINYIIVDEDGINKYEFINNSYEIVLKKSIIIYILIRNKK